VGEPRVEQVTDDVWVAIGFDLANTTLIRTSAGNVVIDPGMSPSRSAVTRDALLAQAPGPTAALIYTHSHIDHVGGASVWMERDTEVWATERFQEHFFKQYGEFLAAENARGARQFARDVPSSQLPCSALGRNVDIIAALEVGVVLPTRTFSMETELTVGDTTLNLVEAHGETDDQLFVWHEAAGVLMPGDNWYRAFPNLYTVRGARPRPVHQWIRSLDAMRRVEAQILVPSHTVPVRGEQAVQEALRDYRDGIQWLRDAVVRGANQGRSIDTIASSVRLPEHLASKPALAELYGQVDWSARAIYGNELGWFDGKAYRLYSLPGPERARRTVQLMGGEEAVLAEATRVAAEADHSWALELLALVEAAREVAPGHPNPLDQQIADSLEALGAATANSNGRGYLLQAALERRAGVVEPSPKPVLSEAFVASIPLPQIFATMGSRLRPEETLERHDSVHFDFTDIDERFVVTIRRGVAEVVQGEPLPGTPEPLATVITDAQTWRRLALGIETGKDAIADGRLKVQGSRLGLLGFLGRFDTGLEGPEAELP
jgi:alkyl sulfatase BDS1-like metallo-beta-lactamase superfamily hydrolase